MLTEADIAAMVRPRLGKVSTFATKDDADLFAAAARRVLEESLSVSVMYDPDTYEYHVIQSLRYIERPGDRTYVL